MTLDEFLVELKALGLKWHVENKVSGYSLIRCENGKCPIVAVLDSKREPRNEPAKVTYGNIFAKSDGESLLGLSSDDAELIIRGADTNSGEIRNKILKAVGLQP